MHSTSSLRRRAVQVWRSMHARHPGWGTVGEADARVRDVMRRTDWTRAALTISDPEHLDLAARAIALGGIACFPLANIYVFAARPAESILRYVNLVKGRPPLQTGSLTTTPSQINEQFNWSSLPRGLDAERVQELIRRLIAVGPIGFRGPARPGLPAYLTADDNGIRTAQVVSGGATDPSNELYARVLGLIPETYLYGTSANRSRHVTGALDEPIHYRLAPVQADFGHTNGFFMISAGDECAQQNRYPFHLPMSTTLLSFHRLGPGGGAQPRIVVERYGSLDLPTLRRIVSELDLDLWFAPTAQRRLTQRNYELDQLPAIGGTRRAA